MVKLTDIAKAAGVSPSTVSNVLNGKKNVGEEMRTLILKLCEEMEYSPNGMARGLKKGNSDTVLFNFSDFDRGFYLKIIKGISDYLYANDFDLIICTKRSVDKFMKPSITCGSIVLDVAMSNERLLKMSNQGYPVVVLDRVVQQDYLKNVVVNNYESMRELVQGLADRGYHKFSFIGGLEKTEDTLERYQAFLDVLQANKIEFSRKNYYSGDYRERSGYTIAKIILLSHEIPEVVVCANDNMALGAIRAFRESGMEIPRDIAVTGFDDSDLAEVAGLTTVAIPNYERGYMAAQALVDMLRGNCRSEVLTISAQVKWRKTVADK